jgi:hypothetical protein
MTRTTRDTPRPSQAPRRARISTFEIGLALAVTIAAMIHLISSLSTRESLTALAEPGGLVRPAR